MQSPQQDHQSMTTRLLTAILSRCWAQFGILQPMSSRSTCLIFQNKLSCFWLQTNRCWRPHLKYLIRSDCWANLLYSGRSYFKYFVINAPTGMNNWVTNTWRNEIHSLANFKHWTVFACWDVTSTAIQQAARISVTSLLQWCIWKSVRSGHLSSLALWGWTCGSQFNCIKDQDCTIKETDHPQTWVTQRFWHNFLFAWHLKVQLSATKCTTVTHVCCWVIWDRNWYCMTFL